MKGNPDKNSGSCNICYSALGKMASQCDDQEGV